MATIGLKVDHGTAGTDLANTLAKALYGDPADAIANAKLKSQLMSDALDRKRIVEATSLLTQQTIDQSMKNRREHDAWLARYGAIPAATDRVNDSILQADEAPVVVEPGQQSPAAAATPAAAVATAPPPRVLGTEPDWEYRVNNYPLVSDRDPVPISFDVPPGLPPVEGVPPDLLAPPPPMPPALSGVPSALQPPPQVPLPPALSGVPRDLQLRPVVGGSQPVVGTGTPVIGSSPPVIGGSPPLVPRTDTSLDPLSQLVQGLLGYYGPPPEVVETAPPEVPTTAIATPPPADYELPVPVDAAERAIATPPPSELGETLMATPPPAGRLSDEYVQPPDVPLVLPTEPGRLSDEFVPPPLPGTAPGRLSDEFVPPPAPPPNVLPTEPGRLSDEYALPPVPVGETEVIKLPGRERVPLPVSPETTAAVPPADAASPSATPATGQPDTAAIPAAAAAAATGTSGGAGDTATTVQTKRGTVTRDEIEAEIKNIMLNSKDVGEAQKAIQMLTGELGITYDERVGPGKDLAATTAAYTRATGSVPLRSSVLGTDEAIRETNATTGAKPELKEVNKRQYEFKKDASGRTVATLVPGQPPADKPSRFGESAEGYLRTGVSDLVVGKPDPKTWTATERQDYAIAVDALYGAKVHVAADGTVVVESGQLPEGVKPGSAGFDGANPPPPTVGAEAPAETQAAPATAAPATAAAPAPVAGQPAAPAQPATGGPKTNAHGRKLTEEGYPAYGGYLAAGEQPPGPTKQNIEGVDISTLKPAERTKEAEGQTGKQVTYTRQALEPASYFLKLKKGDVKVTALQSILNSMSEDTPVEAVINRYTMDPDQREYFRNVVEIVKDMSHKDSGADVTKSDLVTYKSLYSLPLDPTEKDLALLKKSIRTTLRGSREGFNGAVPSEALRAWDREAGRLGIDLDAEENVPAIGASDKPAAGTKKKAKKWNKNTQRFDEVEIDG